MMKLPALAFLFGVSAGHQKEHIGVVSLESGPPPPEDLDSHLRTQDDARKSIGASPLASAVSTNVIERERSPATESEVPATRPEFRGKGEIKVEKVGAAPSSFVERRSGVQSACTLSKRFRNPELVAAEEEDMCASVTTARECMYIDACEWSQAVQRELPRDRSFLQAEMGPDIRLSMKEYCQVKSELTTDMLTVAGLESGDKAREICGDINDKASCTSNNLCRFGCFPPECGCFISEKGMLSAKKQGECDPYMFDKNSCDRTAGICEYRNAGLIFGFPVLWVAVLGALSLICLAGCCFWCIVNYKPGRKKHHHHDHGHAEHEEEHHGEEWEEHHGEHH